MKDLKQNGTLFLISVPIGNKEDLTVHAKRQLETLSTFACEDTRVVQQLMRDNGLEVTHKKLISLHEHNERARIPMMLRFLEAGEDVGVVVTAGAPLVSDPGYVLTREAIRAGVQVKVVPGPTAVLTALMISGLPPDKFVFLGFPPKKPGQQRHFFEKYAALDITLIFFESPKRVKKTLENLRDILSGWQVALCRELTKKHEEVMRGTIASVLSALGDKEVRGEVTVVVSPKA